VRSPPQIFQIDRTMHVVMPKNEFHAFTGRGIERLNDPEPTADPLTGRAKAFPDYRFDLGSG
jgi:hypothetical protein